MALGTAYDQVSKDRANSQTNNELSELNAERDQLRDQLARVNILEYQITHKAEVEYFAGTVSASEIWTTLTSNHQNNEESSTRRWANVLIAQEIIDNDADIENYINENLSSFQGKPVSEVRRAIKNNYRDELLKLIRSQPTLELRYLKMREIADNLDVQGQGDFSESWYQQEYASSRIDPNSGKPVPNATQLVLSKEQAQEYGITLKTTENRRFDEIFGDENSATIREHKHISGKLRGDQETQFEDNITIVQHNRAVKKAEEALTIEKDGKKFRPMRVMYTFATPKGVRANLDFMIKNLKLHEDYLSFEIINSRGEKRTIDINNLKDLNDEPAFSQWLGPDE
jgi:hypothetical protein